LSILQYCKICRLLKFFSGKSSVVSFSSVLFKYFYFKIIVVNLIKPWLPLLTKTLDWASMKSRGLETSLKTEKSSRVFAKNSFRRKKAKMSKADSNDEFYIEITQLMKAFLIVCLLSFGTTYLYLILCYTGEIS